MWSGFEMKQVISFLGAAIITFLLSSTIINTFHIFELKKEIQLLSQKIEQVKTTHYMKQVEIANCQYDETELLRKELLAAQNRIKELESVSYQLYYKESREGKSLEIKGNDNMLLEIYKNFIAQPRKGEVFEMNK